MPEKTINHFMFFKLTDPFWALSPAERSSSFRELTRSLGSASDCVNFYQVSPMQAGIDLLAWSAAPVRDESSEADTFARLGRAAHAQRRLLAPVASFWGYTRPSVYSHAPSPQEIDPFAGQRATYLVLYPFVKTIEWYLLGKDTRQGLMNEHIRIGHQYPEIKQLLLYSFGVQDQEFVVVYETEALARFSDLVNELRGSDVRRYTERDTPVYTGIWRSPETLAEIFVSQEEAQ